jgi:hypothetical protein
LDSGRECPFTTHFFAPTALEAGLRIANLILPARRRG